MTGVKLLGTGRFLPEKIVRNQDYESFVETSDEWIRTRTGMSERHIATTEPTWYLGVQAAQQALESSGVNAADLDLVLVTTVTSDYITPSMACVIQNRIGAVNAFAMDISVACTGLASAMELAWRHLNTGMEHILIVCAESLSQITNYQDRATCVLFGDGAGAAVVGRGSESDLFGSYCRSDASGTHHLYARKTRHMHPFNRGTDTDGHEWFAAAFHDTLFMNGREVYKFATKAMALAVRKACETAGITPEDLNLIIPHQANIRIIETSMKNLGLSMDRCFINIHKYGNTSSATMAIGLDECVREGRIQPGDKVCLVGMGAGLTYGACVFAY